MLDAASISGMFVSDKQTRNDNQKAKKPWFTVNCNIKHSNYFRARNIHCRIRSAETRQNLIRCKTIYQREINRRFHAYFKDFIAKLGAYEQVTPRHIDLI